MPKPIRSARLEKDLVFHSQENASLHCRIEYEGAADHVESISALSLRLRFYLQYLPRPEEGVAHYE